MTDEKIVFEMKKVPFSFFKWGSALCDVCGQSASSFHSGATGEDAYLNGNFCHEHKPKRKLRLPEKKTVIYFEGTCDVCGEPLTMDFDFETRGLIDYGYTEDNVMYTWRRHGREGPIQPACDIYSSTVYEVREEEVPLTEEDKKRITERFELFENNSEGWYWL